MKLFSSLILGVLVAALTANLVAEARGDLLYFGGRSSTKNAEGYYTSVAIDVYDLSTGIVSPPDFAPNLHSYDNQLWEGVAITGGNLYLSGGDRGQIQKYNALTGSHLGTFATVAVPGYDTKVKGMVIDSAGNFYCSLQPGGVAKVSSAGVVNYAWGAPVSGSYATRSILLDTEIFGDTLYVGGMDAGYDGIWAYDLSTGGTAIQLNGTAGTRVDGLAVVSADTMYSIQYKSSTTPVLKWTLDSGVWTSSTAATLSSPRYYAKDIDYIDGSLYISVRKSTSTNAVFKLSDLSGTPTLTEWAAGTSNIPGYIATDVVPEPSMIVLLASGLIGLLAYVWRKRK